VSTLPLIGITTWRRRLATSLGETDLVTLAADYVDAVRNAGGVPLLIPDVRGEEVAAVLAHVDGLLVSGGGDVSPELYDGDPATCFEVDERRDASEMALLRAARELGIPVFGICRGLQVMNVTFGGTLIDDLPSTEAHALLDTPVDKLAARHRVRTTADWASAGLPRDESGAIRVNTLHHQAVDRVAPGFDAVARADDGVIEAMHSVDGDWLARAVQWHPEKMRLPGEATHAPAVLADFVQHARHVAQTRHAQQKETV
jgi:putative glutamine amidotransferase